MFETHFLSAVRFWGNKKWRAQSWKIVSYREIQKHGLGGCDPIIYNQRTIERYIQDCILFQTHLLEQGCILCTWVHDVTGL